MDLSESKNSEDSDDFRVEFVDTSDSDDEGKFGLGSNMDLTCEFCLDKVDCTCLLAVISASVDFL